MPEPSAEPLRLAVLDLRSLPAPRGPWPEDGLLIPAALVALIERLGEDGVLEVAAPSPPGALVQALRARGWTVEPEEAGPPWLLRVGKRPFPAVEDLSELPPPEPAERVLAALAALAPGAVYLARLPRTPRFLFPHLAARGLAFASAERADGTALLWVRR